MIPQSRAANRGAFAQGGLSSGEVVRAVRGICVPQPFPLSEHKDSYRLHGARVHRLWAERGIDPRGRMFGDIACGTGPMMLDYVQGITGLRMTGYYDQEISLDVAAHSTSAVFAAMAEKLPLESQCRVIEMIVRPYRLSLVAEESGG